ncbi:MAG: cation-translocating P-type ATPase, partial [Rhodobacteraceae bacterium]|nr:cation-translocating P-type ATPase [Paracoccaceae bacterium]
MAYALVDRFAIVLPLPELALLVVFLAGAIPAAITALRELFTDHILDVDLLMVIATLAAALVGAPLEGGMLLTLFRLSSMLEHRALGKARRAVEALMSLRPETAFRLAPDGTATEIPIGMLAEGDHVIIRPGARIPVDGRIVKGTGSLDESTITGESIPMVKAPGDRVFEATVNLHTVLTVEVLHPVAESTVARMIAMVTEAQAQKAPSERFSAW